MKVILVLLHFLLFISKTYAQFEPWQDHNPYNFVWQPYVKFIDQNTGWVMVGGNSSPNNNAIFKTTDGGVSWFCASSFITANLQVFHQPFKFTDPDTGYYFLKNYDSGHYFQIYKTTDGANNWSNIYSFLYNGYIWDYFFLDGSIGWIISDRYSPNYSQELLKTVDGGFTWTIKSTMPYTADNTKLVYIDDNNGIILYTDYMGSRIEKTTNGGETWFNVLTLSEEINSIKFKDQNYGYATFGGNLYKTTNGGTSWTQFNISGSYIDLLEVAEDSIIVAAGHTGGFINSNTQVFLSTNGGISWATMTYPGWDNRVFNISIIDPNLVFLSLLKNVVKSVGFSSNWERIPIGPTYNLESVIDIPSGEIFAVGWKQDSITLNFESSIISKNPLWRTKSIHQNQKLKCIAAKNNSELFIGGYDYLNGGRSVIYKCDNKGDNLELKYNSDEQIVNSMQFITELNAIAVGDEGMLLKTQDGGNTWFQETVTTSEDLNFVKFSSQFGFIGGSNGLLLRTSDGGINWSQISLGTTKEIMSILIHTQNNIWLVGKDGLIMKSFDAGLIWNTVNASNEYDFNSISSKDQLHIGIYGGKKSDHSPVIMESHNGGLSFGLENTSLQLKSINFVTKNVSGLGAWAVGDYGTIYLNTDWFTPVELTSFTASVSHSKVKLNWQTATELNNQGFEIQRKLENSEWITIGFRTGKGTTTEPTAYFYEDDISEISVTKIFYKLKQIDFDGTASYSDEVGVATQPFDYALLQNYPNPFNPETIIKYEIPQISNVKIEVFDVLGKVIKVLVAEQKTAGRYEIKFDASSLASGIYYYRIKANEFVQTKKMMLIK